MLRRFYYFVETTDKVQICIWKEHQIDELYEGSNSERLRNATVTNIQFDVIVSWKEIL